MRGIVLVGALALIGCAQPTGTPPRDPVREMTPEQRAIYDSQIANQRVAAQLYLEEDRKASALRAIAMAPAIERPELIRAEALRRIAATDLANGTGASGTTRPTAGQARIRREMSEIEAGIPQAAISARRLSEEERERQAAAICVAKGQMAGAAPAYSGPGLAGAIIEGFSQQQYGNSVAAICWRTWQATRVMPTY